MIHIDAIGAFATVFFNLSFWILVLGRRYLSPLARAYFWWSFYITLWSFGYGVTLGGFFDYQTTLLWNKYCQAMATLIGPFFFRFGCEVADRFEAYKRTFKIYVILGVVSACGLFFTPYYVSGLWSFGPYVYQPLGGPLYGVFTLFFFWCTTHSYWVVARNLKQAIGIKRKQTALFLWATGIAYFGGATLFLQGFRIPFPTHGVFLILGYVAVIGYSVHRYQFFDLPNLVRRTVVFSGLAFFVFSLLAVPFFLLTNVLQIALTGAIRWWFFSFVGIVVAGATRPLNRILIDLTDRYLFQKKYNYHKLLKDNARQIALIHSLDELARQVSAFLITQGRIRNAAMLVKTEAGFFDLKYPLGYGGKAKRPRLMLPEDHPVIQLLEARQSPLVLEQMEAEKRTGTGSGGIEDSGFRRNDGVSGFSAKGRIRRFWGGHRNDGVPEAMELMKSLKAEVLIPSFVGERTNGPSGIQSLRTILVLGGKKSDEPYTEEDLDVFFTVAQDSAVAAERARLFDAVIREREAKVLAEKTAEMVRYATSIKHEIKNAVVGVLNAGMNARTHFLSDIQKLECDLAGLKVPERVIGRSRKIYDEVKRFAENMVKNGEKIFVIANTAAGILKKDENEREKVYLKVIWDEAKQVAARAPDVSDCRFSSSIPDGFSVYGNIVSLEQVLVNLITNASDAMQGGEDKRIHLACRRQEIEGGEAAWFELSDTGPGIPSGLHRRIFEQGFSTKQKPAKNDMLASGSGQGLYVCRKKIEGEHGGKIWAENSPERGAKFIFWIPQDERSEERAGADSR